MPWRDEGIAFLGDSAKDLARHFIQRWNQCKREKSKKKEVYPFLIPKSYDEDFDPIYGSILQGKTFSCNIQVRK